MKKALTLLVLSFAQLQGISQLLFFQDSFKGGIAVDGVSYFAKDYLGSDSISFQINLPVTSIRKAFLLASRFNYLVPSTPQHDNSTIVNFNGHQLVFDSSDIVTSEFHPDPSLASGQVWIVAKDVTNYTLPNGNFLITPDQNSLYAADTTRHFMLDGFLLFVEYDDPLSTMTNGCVYLNNKTYENPISHVLSGMNGIDNSKDVGLSLWCENMFSFPFNAVASFSLATSQGTYSLGKLDDYIGNSNHSKTLPGSFKYINSVLSGIVDDTPDSLVSGTDALLNIKNYIANGAMTFTITSVGSLDPAYENAWLGYVTAYTSPCPPIIKDSTKIYSICAGSSTQLNSSDLNGQNFSWSPSTALTSSASATPVASPTVSTNYILNVTDGNGCHHTELHKVLVYPIPKASGATVTDAVCGDSAGSAIVNPIYGTKPFSYNIGGGAQLSNVFGSLNPGNYTVTVTDSIGCQTQTTFMIVEINQANAAFNIDPSNVCFPASPYVYNTSGSINNYSWYVNGVFQTNSHYPNLSFLDTGKYSITLVGYHNLSQCADTVTKTLFVKECPADSLQITVPNIFSPNADGINDTWQPSVYYYGYTFSEYSVTIFDRWGLKVYDSSISINQSGWDGRSTAGIACSDGTYFYLVRYTAENSSNKTKSETLRGYLQLVH